MSLWNLKEKNRKIKTFIGEKNVDILIIGAGITGLTTAYYLKDTPSLCVVEASLIGHGITLNTNAKITYFQDTIYHKIVSCVGEEKALLYLKSQKEAVKSLVEIIETENIDCDLKKIPSYVFASNPAHLKALEKEITWLKKHHVEVKEKTFPLNLNVVRSFSVEDTYTFHPLKYLEGIYHILSRKNIDIYEKTPIIKFKKEKDLFICNTKEGVIRAKKVIFATHYYPFILPIPYLLPIRSSLEKSYMAVSTVKKEEPISCITSKNPSYSCRFYEGEKYYQISLSGSHDIARKQNDQKHFEEIKDQFHLNEDEIQLYYSNVDIMTMDHMPLVGEIKKNVWIGTGYNTWGMTNSVIASKLISDEVLKRENPYQHLFDPKRKNFIFFLKLPYYLMINIKAFVGSRLRKNKKWYPKNLFFYKKDGKSMAAYIDQNGKKHTIYNHCPHLGCGLIFNEKELTWDCPCHSSRFDIDGKCIKGPSLSDIGVNDKVN